MEALWTIPEFLAAGNITRSKFYALVKAGEVAVVKLGHRTVRVEPRELERLIERGRRRRVVSVLRGGEAA